MASPVVTKTGLAPALRELAVLLQPGTGQHTLNFVTWFMKRERESNSLSSARGNQRHWELVPHWAVERTQGLTALVLTFYSTNICGTQIL